MDRTPADALAVLRRIGAPIRIPTARWLLSDTLDIIDAKVNLLLRALVDEGKIRKESGGWLRVVVTDRSRRRF